MKLDRFVESVLVGVYWMGYAIERDAENETLTKRRKTILSAKRRILRRIEREHTKDNRQKH